MSVEKTMDRNAEKTREVKEQNVIHLLRIEELENSVKNLLSSVVGDSEIEAGEAEASSVSDPSIVASDNSGQVCCPTRLGHIGHNDSYDPPAISSKKLIRWPRHIPRDR
jgi:hypothetical protein